MIRVLLVEDDSEVARIIKYYLGEKERYDVVWAKNAEEAVVVSHDWFDVILMDVMLPDQSGIELCARLREWHSCPVIFISYLDDSRTIIDALEHGGDDYITKPFDNLVLDARIQANLRRVQMERSDTKIQDQLVCRGFTLDAAAHTVLRGGEDLFSAADGIPHFILFHAEPIPLLSLQRGLQSHLGSAQLWG